MARKRTASIETKAKRVLWGALPVVVGGVGLGLLFRYFGDKPIISDAALGLNGNVKSSGFFSYFGF